MPKDSRRLNRREQILKVAAKLFAAKGYHGVTLNEVANQVNLTKASLYYYIKSKKALLEEVSDNMVVGNIESLNAIPESNVPPVEKLRAFITNQIIINARSTELSAIFFDGASSVDKHFYRRFNKYKKRGEKDLQLILQEGVKKGCFAIDDIKMASFLILSACNWVYKWYRPGGRLSPNEIADKYIKLLENGYLSSQSK